MGTALGVFDDRCAVLIGDARPEDCTSNSSLKQARSRGFAMRIIAFALSGKRIDPRKSACDKVSSRVTVVQAWISEIHEAWCHLAISGVVSMGRRNTQLRPTFIENKS
jgi:hypothetical protein